MKKILGILAAVAMVAACNTSCSKSDDNGGGNGGGNTANVRIATWADAGTPTPTRSTPRAR